MSVWLREKTQLQLNKQTQNYKTKITQSDKWNGDKFSFWKELLIQ